MNQLLLGFISLFLFSMNEVTENRSIKLCKTHDDKISNRSISIEPTASHDNNVIYLYSDIALNELQITVKNEIGEIIFTQNITLTPEQPYTYSIENIENGSYILELDEGESKYRGYFEIYQ